MSVKVEDLQTSVEKAIFSCLGHSDSALLSAAKSYLANGYNRQKITDKLSSIGDSKIAGQLAEMISQIGEEARDKRAKQDKSSTPRDERNALKRAPVNANLASVSAARSAEASIKENLFSPAMANIIKPMMYTQPVTTICTREDYEKQRRMAELQERIQRKLSGLVGAVVPPPFIFDRRGCSVDQVMQRVQLARPPLTLMANIRAKKLEELKAQSENKEARELEEAAWFDQRIAAKSAQRGRRALRFHEPGRFQQMADRIRMKAQLEKLQSDISQRARKAGITSFTELALLAPANEGTDDIPEVEWWDSVILTATEANEAKKVAEYPDDITNSIKDETISNLVEHPTQVKPLSEPTEPVHIPMFLTKLERKKLRRQNCREAWKERQDRVRLGLEAAAEPKLRISNLMRVLGSLAVQDPTRMEAHVREQMESRRKAHEEANASRRLTREQRSHRSARKLEEDTSLGVHVGLYRIKDLFESASKKFKVEKNAQQLSMTGCVLLHRGCCLVITEGGPKQHSKYKRLMLRRLNWSEEQVRDAEGNLAQNECRLLWEGTAPRCFRQFRITTCATQRSARELLARHGAQHYWDLACSNQTVQA